MDDSGDLQYIHKNLVHSFMKYFSVIRFTSDSAQNMFKVRSATLSSFIQILKRRSTAFAQLSAYADWLQTHRQTP